MFTVFRRRLFSRGATTLFVHPSIGRFQKPQARCSGPFGPPRRTALQKLSRRISSSLSRGWEPNIKSSHRTSLFPTARVIAFVQERTKGKLIYAVSPFLQQVPLVYAVSQPRPIRVGNTCLYDGLYCSLSTDPNLHQNVKGHHIVAENFRQLCIFNQTAGKNRDKATSMWWDYIDLFNKNCNAKDKAPLFDSACSEAQMKAASYTTVLYNPLPCLPIQFD